MKDNAMDIQQSNTPSENRAKPQLWYPNEDAKRIGDWINSIPVESFTGKSDEEFLGK